MTSVASPPWINASTNDISIVSGVGFGGTKGAGEETLANAPRGRQPGVKLQLRIQGVLAGDTVTLQVNGNQLPAGKWDKPPTPEPTTRWFHLEPDPAIIRAGTNVVEIEWVGDTPGDGNLLTLELPVRYV